MKLTWLDKDDVEAAQRTMVLHHYLHQRIHQLACPQGYGVWIAGELVGYILFGRLQSTRCGNWYGSLEDIEAGRCESSKWEVLNLARMWLDPKVQRGGEMYRPDLIPCFTDRYGVRRSALASSAIRAALKTVAFDYLWARPPVALDQPWKLKWSATYCDTRVHRGTIYGASGYELVKINSDGIQTYRQLLPPLTGQQSREIERISLVDERANKFRAKLLLEKAA